MGLFEKILLALYYPQFKTHNISRFESFFDLLSKKYSNEQKISKLIFPEKIIRNEDKRTSLLIKGIPKFMSKTEIKDFIEKFGNINYFYITKEIKSKNFQTFIAFINVINYKSIIPLYMNLRNLKIINNGYSYNLEIIYSKIQGREELKNYIKNKYFLRKTKN